MKTNGNNYPVVLVHGYLGWGEDDKREERLHYWGAKKDCNLIEHLRDEDYTVFAPSLGPMSSAWDRSCELWAYLVGGRVDYGKVHSKKYGHARFGRTYPGVLKDWGRGENKKINIFGHSFGGPTVITFCNILSEGSKEEQEGTKESDLSDFFKGNKGDWIHTCTTLSGVNNGTILASIFGRPLLKLSSFGLFMGFGAKAEESALKDQDPHLDRYGLQREPKDIDTPIENNMMSFKNILNALKFTRNDLDNIIFEMGIETASKAMPKYVKANPHVYYFARVADCSKKNILGMYHVGEPFSKISIGASYISGSFISRRLKKMGITKEWLKNDGLVSVPGQKAPFHLESIEWDENPDTAKPGIWHNCPSMFWSHLSWDGFDIPIDDFYKFYDKSLELYRSLPDG